MMERPKSLQIAFSSTVPGMPHVEFIDRNGIIRRSASGYRSLDVLKAELKQSGILPEK
jgi:hypothetical protein